MSDGLSGGLGEGMSPGSGLDWVSGGTGGSLRASPERWRSCGTAAGRAAPRWALEGSASEALAERGSDGSVSTGEARRGQHDSTRAIVMRRRPEVAASAATERRESADRGGSAAGQWASDRTAAGAGMTAGLLDGVRQWLAESGGEPTPARVAQALREQGRVLGDAEVLGAAEQLRSELVGSGPLEPLLADPSVTDVLVSAPDRVWVDRGGGLELTSVSFPDAAAVRRLAQRLAAVAGRRLDDARPWVDARLPDGTRLHAVLPPVLRLPGAAGRTAEGVHARRAGRGRHGTAGWGPGAAGAGRRTAVVPHQWRDGQRQDDAAERVARAGRGGRADRARGGLGGAQAGTPPCRTAGEQTRQPGGCRARHP